MRARTDIGMTRKSDEAGDAGQDEAHLARYQRSYRITAERPERFYWLRLEAMAHALLEQQPERSYI